MPADAGQGQAGRGQNQIDQLVAPPVAARFAQAPGGKPAQGDGEQDDQQQAQPERGDGDACEGEQIDRVIAHGIGLHCRPNAERQPDTERQRQADAEQGQGVAQGRGQDVEHRFGEQAGKAEISLKRRPQPSRIAFDHRAVQSVDFAQLRDIGRGQLRIGGNHHVYGIAGHQADQGEHDKGHDRQDKDGLNQTFGDEAQHGPSLEQVRPRRNCPGVGCWTRNAKRAGGPGRLPRFASLREGAITSSRPSWLRLPS